MDAVRGQDFISGILDTMDSDVDGATASAVQMAFTVKKFVLHALLDKAGLVVPTKDSMSVLKNFQVSATVGRLRVTATDLELAVIATTEMVTVETPGTAVLPARKLRDIMVAATDADVAITVLGLTASIDIGRTTWSLKLQGGDDYPPMPVIRDAQFTTVERVRLLSALGAVRYAACKDTTRASLMMIDVKGGRLTACDGARFQQASLGDFPLDCQIPIGAVDYLVKLLRTLDLAEVRVGQSDHHLIFVFGSDVFFIKKFVAQFPDMEKQLLRPVLENKQELIADRLALLGVVRRVRVNADSETSAIMLDLAPGELTLSTRDKYGNTACERIEASWAGKPRTVVVNHAYLTDMVNGYDGVSCVFRLGEDTKQRKTALMLRDEHAGTVGVVQQMHPDWVTA